MATVHIPEGSLWNYPHWGGNCIAKWVDGELWVGRDDNANSDGVRIFKTRNGDGKRLTKLNTVTKVLWDNHDNHSAFMPDPNTISVFHGNTIYNFTHVGSPLVATEAPGDESSGNESSGIKVYPKESAVLISDMSGFTANVRKYGVIHVTSMILKQRNVLKPVWLAYGALDIWYEADNNWVTFPNTQTAISAALEASRIIKEYNSSVKPEFTLNIAGFGIDSGDEVTKDLLEGKIFGPSVDDAFFLGEDVATGQNVLVSERAWLTVKDNPHFAENTVTAGVAKDVPYVTITGNVKQPVCQLNHSVTYGDTPIEVLCKRATFPDQAPEMDIEIAKKFIKQGTAIFFGIESAVVTKKHGLKHWIHMQHEVNSVISAIFSTFKGAEKQIFNFWLFDNPSNALRAALSAKKAIAAHNALCADEDVWPIKGFGIHTSDMLTLPHTDISFGDAANTASKLSEDGGENLSIYITHKVLGGVGFLRGLKTEAKLLDLSGVKLECYLTDIDI